MVKQSTKIVTGGAALAATDLLVLAEEHGAILTFLSVVLTFGLPWFGFKLARYRRVP